MNAKFNYIRYGYIKTSHIQDSYIAPLCRNARIALAIMNANAETHDNAYKGFFDFEIENA